MLDPETKRRTDYIMANPPFNLKDWRAADTATQITETQTSKRGLLQQMFV